MANSCASGLTLSTHIHSFQCFCDSFNTHKVLKESILRAATLRGGQAVHVGVRQRTHLHLGRQLEQRLIARTKAARESLSGMHR
jgi:hypothetical protein